MTSPTPAANWAPTLTAADLHFRLNPSGKTKWPHVQLLAHHPTGPRIRFTLDMISDYPEHLVLTVEAFGTETLSWNPLWQIRGTEYEFATEVDAVAEDPANNLIARAWSRTGRDHQARSWQKIIHALAAKADEILTGPA